MEFYLWLWSQPLLMRSCGRMDCAYVCATSALYAAMRLLSCLRSACIFCTALLQPESPHPNACMPKAMASSGTGSTNTRGDASYTIMLNCMSLHENDSRLLQCVQHHERLGSIKCSCIVQRQRPPAGRQDTGDRYTLLRAASSVRYLPMAAKTRPPAMKRSRSMPLVLSMLLILIACAVQERSIQELCGQPGQHIR